MAGPEATELTQAGFWPPELAGFMRTRLQYPKLCLPALDSLLWPRQAGVLTGSVGQGFLGILPSPKH